ncbi:5-oxoprolinase subunit PxpB [Thalassomonas sp. M1454]|uniref:5-oxoprolinase subunit PxpB n=1 Tax=Thalassomonas sp. M1454 TaxID=2594477 RepID=UPI0011809730|nr:5-oxoprolinase subunit PxpB [Thalassomonas sp. M1454]TRX56878.1 5-oxoprolinase subunit PxpB [Thalassomonas sp. M1454]
MKVSVAGENSFIIYFAEQASKNVSLQVQQACVLLKESLGSVLIDLVPSYASLLVIYNPMQTDGFHVRHIINSSLSNLSDANENSGKVVTLPVYYSAESGADLVDLAKRANLTTDEVIDIHQQGEYLVYAIGFAPGFAYLGEVDERIAAPRLSSPRLKVPKGAVAIADRQTAIYPAESPGGWNLIGSCPIAMFDPKANPTMPVEVGDIVKFKAIDREQYLALGGEL